MRYLSDKIQHTDEQATPNEYRRERSRAFKQDPRILALDYERGDPLAYFRGGGPDPSIGVASPVLVRRVQ